jgi:hypothetical protein
MTHFPFSPPFALIPSDQRDYAEAKALVLRLLSRCVQCRRVMFFCWEPNSNSTFSWYCEKCLGHRDFRA